MESANTFALPAVKTKTDTLLLKELNDFREYMMQNLANKDDLNKVSTDYFEKRFNQCKGKGKNADSKVNKTKKTDDGSVKEKKEPSEYNKFIGENIRSLRAETPGLTFKAAMEVAVAKWNEIKKQRALAQKASDEANEENAKPTEVPKETSKTSKETKKSAKETKKTTETLKSAKETKKTPETSETPKETPKKTPETPESSGSSETPQDE